MEPTKHPRRRISQQLAKYADMDMKRLRTMYRRVNEDLPHSMLMSASRKMIADRLVVEQFGEKAVDEYYEQVAIWKEMQAFVEGKISNPNEEIAKRRGRRRKSSK